MNNYPNNNNGYGNDQYNNNNQNYAPNMQNNNYHSQPNPKLTKSLKDTSLSYIVSFFLSLIFSIAAFAVSITGTLKVFDPHTSGSEIEKFEQIYLALEVMAIIFSLVTFIIAIILIVKVNAIKKQRRDCETIFILTIVGIFVPFVSLVASFMILSKLKKTNSDYSYNQGYGNNRPY